MSYTHYTLEERKYLQDLLAKGYSFRKIANYLGRSPSSVSREVKRNRSKKPKNGKSNNKYCYHSWRAQILTVLRRKSSRHYRIKSHTEEWNYIIWGISQFWTPEEVAFRWRRDYPLNKIFGVSTVYRAIARGYFPNISRRTHLRRRGKRIVRGNIEYNTIKPERIIPEWSEVIKKRLRIGDWEGDTILSKPGNGVIITLVDRRSKYLLATVCHTKKSEVIKDAIIKMFKGYPVKSISFDNGSEFAKFKEIERELKAPIYFAEPHKPWQRGTNENTNGILRYFLPKSCNFLEVTQQELDNIVNLLNNRPRKALGWKTPAEVFFSDTVALA